MTCHFDSISINFDLIKVHKSICHIYPPVGLLNIKNLFFKFKKYIFSPEWSINTFSPPLGQSVNWWVKNLLFWGHKELALLINCSFSKMQFDKLENFQSSKTLNYCKSAKIFSIFLYLNLIKFICQFYFWKILNFSPDLKVALSINLCS